MLNFPSLEWGEKNKMLQIEMEKLAMQHPRNELKEFGSVLGPETEESGSVGTAVNSVFAVLERYANTPCG